MKKLLMGMSILILMTSCSQKKVILNYDQTNPIRIEMANQGLDLSKILPSPSNIDGTIAVRSIEGQDDWNLDYSAIYSIEDHLIANLITSGYRAVERDPDALDNLYKEELKNYSKDGPNYRWTVDALINKDGILKDLNPSSNLVVIGDEGKETSDVTGCCDQNSEIIEYLVDEHKMLSEVEKNSLENNLVNTGLTSADYVLSYRILESGVQYYEYDREDKFISINNEDKVERSARTRLHVRLTDSKTSEILAAGLVENEVKDIIRKDDMKSLKQMPYEYYHHTLPVAKMGENKEKYTDSSGHAKSKSKAKIESKKKGLIPRTFDKIQDKVKSLF